MVFEVLHHRYGEKHTPFIDPFNKKRGIIDEFHNRIQVEGYFGPTYSLDRSLAYEKKARAMIERTKTIKQSIKQKLEQEPYNFPETAPLFFEIKTKEISQEWGRLKQKGKEEEQVWTEKAIATVGAAFEYYQSKKSGKEFELRDNQLYYLALQILSKGTYDFGRLETTNRGIQLPTGEGKTYCSGLAGAILTLQGEQVHIVEPNYISAQDHARQMGGFFDFLLHEEVGVVVDLSEKGQRVTEKRGRVLKVGEEPTGQRQSYIFQGGGIKQEKGSAGRKKAWSKKIVYADINSVAFDYLDDTNIGVAREAHVQPPLSNRIALVQEADAPMIDDAQNQWIISEPVAKDEVWPAVANMFDFDQKRWKANKKITKELIQTLTFTIWGSLVDAKAQGYFIEGEGEDYLRVGKNIILSERISEKAKQKVLADLSTMNIPLDRHKNRVLTMFWRNQETIDTALKVLLGITPQTDFIAGEKPTLLDAYGIPLDNRQFSGLYQIFLQLQNIWHKEKADIQTMTWDKLGELIDAYKNSIELSRTMHRISVPQLLKKYKAVRFTSGSLIPAAKTFADVYEAEVLAVGRHEAMIQPTVERNADIRLRCLDGGYADAFFVSSHEAVAGRVHELQSDGRVGLIIMPSIGEAYNLFEMLKKKGGTSLDNIKVVTGVEELKRRGSFAAATTTGSPKDIIITTQMAHRDVDVKLTPEVISKGGMESIVCGNFASERAFWQALQRAARSDVPGSRRLYLTRKDLEPAAQSGWFGSLPFIDYAGAAERLHKEKVGEIDKLFDQTVTNRKDPGDEVWLFQIYLNEIRSKEDDFRKGLLMQMIRDDRLEKWRTRFITTIIDYMSRSKKWKKYADQKTFNPQYDEDRRRLLFGLSSAHIAVPTGEQTERFTHASAGQVLGDQKTANIQTLESDPLAPILARLQKRGGVALPPTATTAIFRGLVKEEIQRKKQATESVVLKELRYGWSDFLITVDQEFTNFFFQPNIPGLSLDQLRVHWISHMEEILDGFS